MAVGKKKNELYEYEKFTEKFKQKKTTDDCTTPAYIYEVVANYVHQRYGVERENMLRPFWPEKDYKQGIYTAGCCVVDNPPFSKLAEIMKFYLEREIKFFLFAPSLTLFSSEVFDKVDHIVCAFRCVYENGAKVDTSFVTNLERENIVESGVFLSKELNKAQNAHKTTRKLNNIKYPSCLLTSAKFRTMVSGGVNFALKRGEYFYTRQLDAQKQEKKTIFGSGLVLSENAEKRLQQAKERAQYSDYKPLYYDYIFNLSEREKEMRRELK